MLASEMTGICRFSCMLTCRTHRHLAHTSSCPGESPQTSACCSHHVWVYWQDQSHVALEVGAACSLCPEP